MPISKIREVNNYVESPDFDIQYCDTLLNKIKFPAKIGGASFIAASAPKSGPQHAFASTINVYYDINGEKAQFVLHPLDFMDGDNKLKYDGDDDTLIYHYYLDPNKMSKGSDFQLPLEDCIKKAITIIKKHIS